jgi:hypothetical protein
MVYNLAKFYWCDEFKNDDMDGENVMFGGKEKYLQKLWWGNPKIRCN